MHSVVFVRTNNKGEMFTSVSVKSSSGVSFDSSLWSLGGPAGSSSRPDGPTWRTFHQTLPFLTQTGPVNHGGPGTYPGPCIIHEFFTNNLLRY